MWCKSKSICIILFNHNKDTSGGGDGAEVVYALRNNSKLANKILDNLVDAGQNKREAYQRRLPSNTAKDYYFIHRNTGVTEPVLVEYGFLDSTGDDVNQLKNNAEKYANAVVDALLDYIGVPSGNTYTVVKGDSLWSVAKKFDVSVEDLKLANNLSSSLLNVGQVLKIPTQDEPITGDYVVYTVSSGDTLYSIANRYGVSVNDLIEYNNLGSTSLVVGQQILIPSVTDDESSNTYIVKSGDSLYSIANKYGITVDELKSANNLTSNVLSINQKLTIPGSEESVYYVVKPGDSLYSIANKYGVTVNELKTINGLTSNILSINQRLIIPNTNNAETYTVKSGDSLYSIASRYNTSVSELKSANNLTSNLLSVGQILIIPE